MKNDVEYIELNMSNYDTEDVAKLNAWGIWAVGHIGELTAKLAAAEEKVDDLESRLICWEHGL